MFTVDESFWYIYIYIYIYIYFFSLFFFLYKALCVLTKNGSAYSAFSKRDSFLFFSFKYAESYYKIGIQMYIQFSIILKRQKSHAEIEQLKISVYGMIPLNMRELFKIFCSSLFLKLKNQYFQLFARFNTRHLILRDQKNSRNYPCNRTCDQELQQHRVNWLKFCFLN